MAIDFNFLNLITLIGGVQGFSLGVFLLRGKKNNKNTFWFFLIFLLSLSLFNTLYALNYMGIYKIGFVPLTAFPIPEDYLIGIGLYFYIVRHKALSNKKMAFRPEYLLFLPVAIYGFVRLYWYIIFIQEGTNRIAMQVYNSRFYDVNEIVVNLFYIGLLYAAWKFVHKHFQEQELLPKQVKHAQWLKRLIRIFTLVTVFNLIIYVLSIIINAQDYTIFYYPKLIINSAFIYWIGFVGFTKRNQLFIFLKEKDSNDEDVQKLYRELYHYMMINEAYKKPDLNLSELSVALNVSTKKLSSCIHKIDKINFSEYVNIFRIENVKKLLQSDKSATYTLVALAKESGFKSKSSFYAIFKKIVGMTPSEYKDQYK